MVSKCKFLMSTAISLCFLSASLSAMEEEVAISHLRVPTSFPKGQDNFDFLSTTYPNLVPEAEKLFVHCREERQHYEKLKQLMEEHNASAKDVLTKGAKEVLNRTTLHWFGPNHEQFVLAQLHPMITTLQRNHPTHGYFKTFFDRALKNHTLAEDIVLASEYIFQVVKDEGGGTVLFLGRTPCLIQLAYEAVLKAEQDKTQTPVHLNFSGHPDALTKRESSFFKSETNIARDIVTPKKLSHYFSYLDTKDLLKTKKLFIIDILGSGGSLNSFLRIMNAYYQSRSGVTPTFSFLNLTQDMNWSMDRSEFYTFKRGENVSNRGTLTLPEDKTKNMRHFQVSTYGIPIFDKVLTDMLDEDMFQEFLVRGIQYPAQKWTPEFDTQREKGGEYHTSFYEHLRHMFSIVVGIHKNK